MESLGQDKVLQSEDVKEAREQIKSEKQEAKASKKEARDSTTPLKKLISYAELAGIVFMVSRFKKPILKLASKIFNDIEQEKIKVDEELKTKILGAELALRKLIVENYLKDPIQAYRIGPELYNQLVVNGGWQDTVLTINDPIPANMSSTFTVGTGVGAISVSSQLVKGLSVEILALCEFLVADGRALGPS